jgi:hypothetical protein
MSRLAAAGTRLAAAGTQLAAAGTQQQPKKLTVASLLRQYTPAYIKRHPKQAAPQVQSTLAKLELCWTAALGGRWLYCQSCDLQAVVYNSCGDRHCPQCRGGKRADWVERMTTLLLPGVDYFQVVFTLPQELSSLALGNRRTLYNLLFRSASQALKEILAEQFGLEAASLVVLHTWNQRLEHHPHVHLLVPGGGPSLDGKRWVKTRHPKFRNKRKPYLVDNRLLSQRFRDLFLKAIEKLQSKGELQVKKKSEFDTLLADMQSIDWVVFIQAPPNENASPEQVIKYLARYMTGGPISDKRLVSHESGKVTIQARRNEKSTDGDSPKQVHVTLDGVEFVRRWSLHILPKGFVKVRRYGGFSNRRCEAYLELCRELLGLAVVATDPAEEVNDGEFEEPEEVCRDKCPKCNESMITLVHQNRPSWSDTMSGLARPTWYRDG